MRVVAPLRSIASSERQAWWDVAAWRANLITMTDEPQELKTEKAGSQADLSRLARR
jgi:hypothetical protein